MSDAEDEPMCRICWSQATSQEDPLQSPCACSGSMRHVHRNCNALWMRQSKRAHCELCKQRMLPRRQQRWLTFLYVLDCLQAPLYYGAFGCVCILIPFLVGVFVLLCCLPFRYGGDKALASPVPSVPLPDSELYAFAHTCAHALEHFTLLKLLGDFVLLVAHALWRTIESRPRSLGAVCKCIGGTLATHSTFEVIWERLTRRSLLRAGTLLSVCFGLLAAPVLAGEAVGCVLGLDAGMAVWRCGYLTELGLGASAALLWQYL